MRIAPRPTSNVQHLEGTKFVYDLWIKLRSARSPSSTSRFQRDEASRRHVIGNHTKFGLALSTLDLHSSVFSLNRPLVARDRAGLPKAGVFSVQNNVGVTFAVIPTGSMLFIGVILLPNRPDFSGVPCVALRSATPRRMQASLVAHKTLLPPETVETLFEAR